ncbi:MAG: hypothetical protein AAF639_34040 [Chloroflexota bacterium]
MAVFIFIVGCSSEDALIRAERPRNTSTPAPSVDGQSTTDIVVPTIVTGERTSALEMDSLSIPASDLRNLTTQEQLAQVVVPIRDLRDLSIRLKPDVDEIPEVVVDEVREYEIGDRIEFWAHDLRDNSNFQLTAELIHKTDVAYAWVRVGDNYDKGRIVRSVNRFSEVSYPAEREFFGSEWIPGVDLDPRLHILHSTGLGSGVAGYYSSADQYSRLANEFSNEKEMFYINLSWLNSSQNYEYYETVLAHEYQHMVHWINDRNEETWINEGLSEFAQEVAEYDPDTIFASSFAATPDTQLNTWGEDPGNNSEHYGSSYLFIAYFAQRFGPEMTRSLVANPANGIDGINAVLEGAGLEQRFDDVFGDWLVANYVDDVNALGLDGVYGYRKFEQAPPVFDQRIDVASSSDIPDAGRFAVTTTVGNYATDYILLENSRNLPWDAHIIFNGQTTTQLVDAQPYSGKTAWWGNRTDSSDSRLTRKFDLRDLEQSDEPVWMDVAMWWNIEEDYDYGYVTASVDGENWQILPGPHTTTDNPSGNSFGHAYTGKSGVVDEDETSQWVIESFDLGAYRGEEVWIRFEYVTDDAVNSSGWLVDDISIPAIGYSTTFESDTEIDAATNLDGWVSEGWLLTDNQLTQRWLVQAIYLDDKRLQSVERIVVDDLGAAQFRISDYLIDDDDGFLSKNQTVVLTISGLAPVTTEPAVYGLSVGR